MNAEQRGNKESKARMKLEKATNVYQQFNKSDTLKKEQIYAERY